ncbi:uncharacterized protein METZ01_LOCUS235982, partial [marine metagenome]
LETIWKLQRRLDTKTRIHCSILSAVQHCPCCAKT